MDDKSHYTFIGRDIDDKSQIYIIYESIENKNVKLYFR